MSSPLLALSRDGIELGAILEDLGLLAYLAIALLVTGDGVIPILPGESTIAAGAALAGAGDLRLAPVIACAVAGAVTGDSITYWIGRGGAPRIRRTLCRLVGEHRVRRGESVFERNATPAIVLGRWVPGLRFTVALSAGTVGVPYRRFLPLVAAGGFGWAIQNALIGFYIGRAFHGDLPLAVGTSVVAALVLSAAIAVAERRRRR